VRAGAATSADTRGVARAGLGCRRARRRHETAGLVDTRRPGEPRQGAPRFVDSWRREHGRIVAWTASTGCGKSTRGDVLTGDKARPGWSPRGDVARTDKQRRGWSTATVGISARTSSGRRAARHHEAGQVGGAGGACAETCGGGKSTHRERTEAASSWAVDVTGRVMASYGVSLHRSSVEEPSRGGSARAARPAGVDMPCAGRPRFVGARTGVQRGDVAWDSQGAPGSSISQPARGQHGGSHVDNADVTRGGGSARRATASRGES
jgi:hypothetical protein